MKRISILILVSLFTIVSPKAWAKQSAIRAIWKSVSVFDLFLSYNKEHCFLEKDKLAK